MRASKPPEIARPVDIATYYPLRFSAAPSSRAADTYLADPLTRKIVEFFERKGVPTIKEEDRIEHWYEDWLTFQAENRIYASLLAPGAA